MHRTIIALEAACGAQDPVPGLIALRGEIASKCAELFMDSTNGDGVGPSKPEQAHKGLKLPGRYRIASVPLNECNGAEKGVYERLDKQPPRLEGTIVFEGIFVRKGILCFEPSAAFAEYCAELCIDAVGSAAPCAFDVPEIILIPKRGVAVDREASAYARSLLIGCSKSREFSPTAQAKEALFRSILLNGSTAPASGSAVSAAVRSALEAYESGALGGVQALAMAASLGLADLRIAKND